MWAKPIYVKMHHLTYLEKSKSITNMVEVFIYQKLLSKQCRAVNICFQMLSHIFVISDLGPQLPHLYNKYSACNTTIKTTHHNNILNEVTDKKCLVLLLTPRQILINIATPIPSHYHIFLYVCSS